MAADRAEIERRLAERNRRDSHSGWLLIILGIPFAIVGILTLSWLITFLLILTAPVEWSWGACFIVALSAVMVAATIDCWRHPSEHWKEARYYLTDGTVSGATFDGWFLEHQKGGFSGMPLMTNMSDPHNWAMRGSAIANGCGNLVLGGPRNIRKGIEALRLIRVRSNKKTIDGAMELLSRIERAGSTEENELHETLAAEPRLRSGYLLADQLGFLARRLVDGKKIVSLRVTAP